MPLPSTINDLSKTAGSNFPQGTDSPSNLDDTQRAHASFIAQLRDGDHVAAATAKTTPIDADFFPMNDSAASSILKKVTWANIKAALKTYFDTLYAAAGAFAASGANTDITSRGNNTSTVYTTAGTSTAYTITPNPVIASYAVGQSFMVNFNATSGASPTLQINGIATPPNLVKENPDGTYSNIAANDIPSNHRSRVTLISTTQALVERLGATVTAGGVAPVFGARAWCVFNGTTLGTNAPLAGGNVSTVQRTALGTYLITMSTALADTNFSITGSANTGGGSKAVLSEGATARSTTTFEVVVSASGGASSQVDQSLVSVAVFR